CSCLRFLLLCRALCCFFLFCGAASCGLSTLSLHDALPIYLPAPGPDDAPTALGGCGSARPDSRHGQHPCAPAGDRRPADAGPLGDRKSTRLNSSHVKISYVVFCLKKKKGGWQECAASGRSL